MKWTLELETEVGKCDYEGETGELLYAEPEFATLYARTEAAVIGRKVLKVEQHCFLRHGDEMPEQPWIKPRVVVEPGVETEEQMGEMVHRLHEEFVENARKELPAQFVA